MSVEMVVFVAEDKMIGLHQWQSALQKHGFDLKLDQEADLNTHEGFLPCSYKGEECGFEFIRTSVAESEPDPELEEQIGARGVAISFITHSESRDLMASVIAAGVLCSEIDGVLLDTDSDEFVASKDALQWARTGEADISQDL